MPKRRLPLEQIPPPDRREVSFWVSKEERQRLADLARENNVAVGEIGRAILWAYVQRWGTVKKDVLPVLREQTEVVRIGK